MMKYFLILFAAVPVMAQTCTYTPARMNFTAGGAALPDTPILVVASDKSCVWTATTTDSWIHITNAQAYVGTQTVTFALDASTLTAARTGAITIGDNVSHVTVTITQSAGVCNYSIGPPVTASYPQAGGNGTFTVASGCSWNLLVPSWVTINSSGGTLGNATVSYTVSANGSTNSCVAARTGTISLVTSTPNPPTFTISQDGASVPLSFSPASATFGPAATSGKVQVVTGDGCGWSIYVDVNWIQALNTSGSGAGAISFTISQNIGPARTGHITAGAQVFTITQTGVSAPGPVLSGLINSASGATGAISPGEIVSLFGSNMGPTTGVAFGQTIPFMLANVQVMFGNSPAPLTYVSASQINAVVPYSVAPGGTVPITVQYQGQVSNAMPATVQFVTPALFSADLSGHGPGAILNFNYVLNSNVNPAPIGSVVMIYATGGGVTNPPSNDGSVAPSAEPFARLVAPPTVTIGGFPAQVVYAGGAPGLISGLTQVNVVVPGGVKPGPSVPVVLLLGGSQSQTGVTIAVQ
jgi:uncharacterized protein (TIGR03437 family)